jgi:hypothetical protein
MLNLWKEVPSYTRYIKPGILGDPFDIAKNVSVAFSRQLGFHLTPMSIDEIKSGVDIPSNFTAQDFSSGVITGLSRDSENLGDKETLATFDKLFTSNPMIVISKPFRKWIRDLSN